MNDQPGHSTRTFPAGIHSRQVRNVEMAAREMGGLSLADALLLCELLAKTDVARYERAALRWLTAVHRRAATATHRGRAGRVGAGRTPARTEERRRRSVEVHPPSIIQIPTERGQLLRQCRATPRLGRAGRITEEAAPFVDGTEARRQSRDPFKSSGRCGYCSLARSFRATRRRGSRPTRPRLPYLRRKGWPASTLARRGFQVLQG